MRHESEGLSRFDGEDGKFDKDIIPPELIKYIPENERDKFVRAFALRVEQYSGPVPHPSVAARWEATLPGSADRMLTMSEQNQTRRLDMDEMIVREFLSREKLGMLLYFALALAMMLGGIAIILSGYSTAGLVAMGAPVAGLAGSFILSQRNSDKRSGDSDNTRNSEISVSR